MNHMNGLKGRNKMFKRKIGLKKARKLADCVPEGLKEGMKFLNENYSPIVSLEMPMLKISTPNKNLRNYLHLNDKSTWQDATRAYYKHELEFWRDNT